MLGTLALLLAGLVPGLRDAVVAAPLAGAAQGLLATLALATAVLVVGVGWPTLGRQQGSAVALVSCAFAGVALLDAVALLAAGLPGQRAAVAAMAARTLAPAALLAIALLPRHRLLGAGERRLLLAVLLALAAAVVTLRWDRLALAAGPEFALTLAVLAGAAALGLAWRQRRAQPYPAGHLGAAALLLALAELALGLRRGDTDLLALLSALERIAAFLLVYRAVFLDTLQKPFAVLRTTQRDLQASEARWRRLFENSLDGVLLSLPDGSIRAANAAACRMFRMSEQELVQGGRAAITLPGDSRLAAMLRERQGSGHAFGELTMRRGDGSTFEAEVAMMLYTDSAGRTTASVLVRDITQRKLFEREILRLNVELEQRVAQRTAQLEGANRDLERFSYAVAHDLRAPLAGIGGFSGALEHELGATESERVRHFLARIRANAIRMEGMIEALLALAQVSRMELSMQPLDLSAIARDVLQQLREREPDRAVVAEIQDGLRARGDPRLLSMLMQNLVGNAWKFTARTAGARIAVGGQADADGALVFHVRDNGAGFDMAGAHRLFGVFQRLHDGAEFPGHGVGLVNVKRIVERHNGRIWAEGRPGEGACFRFTLPGEEAPPPPHDQVRSGGVWSLSRPAAL